MMLFVLWFVLVVIVCLMDQKYAGLQAGAREL
jgi:hypothetical protein